MPELPEVETMRRGIEDVAGALIQRVRRPACRRKPLEITPGLSTFRRRVEGQRVAGVERAGKRVVLRLASDDRIVFEPRMTGLVLRVDPPTAEHLRFRLDFRTPDGDETEILYWDRRGLGKIHLFSAPAYQEMLLASLGPDALDVTGDLLRDRLGRSVRAVKVALLDQKAIAGIGNLYAAEILHVARIHPNRRCVRLSRRQWDALAAATRTVLSEAIQYEGSTLSDGTYRNALNRAGGYQNQHRVYGKEGKPCPRCRDASIRRSILGQRATFYCAKCQKA